MNLVDRLCEELRRRSAGITPQVLHDALRALDVTLVEGQRTNVARHLSTHEGLARKAFGGN